MTSLVPRPGEAAPPDTQEGATGPAAPSGPSDAPTASGTPGGRGRMVGRLVAAVVARLRRLRSPGRALRVLPIALAALVGVTTALLVRPLAERSADARESAIWADFNAQAADRFAAVYRALAGGARPDDGYAWIVAPDGSVVEHFGESDFTPPLADLASRTTDGRAEQWLSYLGDRRALMERLDDDRIVVLIQDTGWVGDLIDDARSGAFRRGWITVGAAALLAGLAAWLAVRPLRSTLADRREFLADAAHEMRTPLAVIRASAGHALARPRTTEEYVRSLSEIRSAAERASSGVTELLDLARFESGQAVPRLAPLRLDLLAEEVAVASRYDGVEITHEVGPSVLVDADLALLRQAIDNLVRNAAARGTRVQVRARLEGRDGVLEVLDDGPGFRAEQLPYVFERFRRADRSGSTGLGLAIVAAITAAHGGSAEAANRPEGGACVTLRIPRSRT